MRADGCQMSERMRPRGVSRGALIVNEGGAKSGQEAWREMGSHARWRSGRGLQKRPSGQEGCQQPAREGHGGQRASRRAVVEVRFRMIWRRRGILSWIRELNQFDDIF